MAIRRDPRKLSRAGRMPDVNLHVLYLAVCKGIASLIEANVTPRNNHPLLQTGVTESKLPTVHFSKRLQYPMLGAFDAVNVGGGRRLKDPIAVQEMSLSMHWAYPAIF